MEMNSVGSWIERHMLVKRASHCLGISRREAEKLYDESPANLQRRVRDASREGLSK